jgi:hypothetical protein
MRLFRVNLRKLVRRPATWVTFLLLVGLLLLIMLAIVAASHQSADPDTALASRLFVTFPGAWTLMLSVVLGIGGLLALTYGAAIAGSEWTWGTLKAAVARGESRSRYTLVGFAAVAVATWLMLLAAYLVGIAASMVGAVLTGVSLSGVGDGATLGQMPDLFARAALGTAMEAGLGFAIATIARSQLAGIGVGIGVYFAEGIAGIFVPDVIRWFPFAAASALISGAPTGGAAGSGGVVHRLDPNTAVIATLAWLVVALLAAAAWTERAEISG